jgi:hypothetical protein
MSLCVKITLQFLVIAIIPKFFGAVILNCGEGPSITQAVSRRILIAEVWIRP